MADVLAPVKGIGAGLSSSLSTTSTYALYLMIIFVVMAVVVGVLFFVLNKRSYRTTVVVLRPRGGSAQFDYEAGMIGKHYTDRKKELRFKIYNAKKMNVQYNNEPIDQKYLIKRFIKGRYNPLVFMVPNSEGWLQPTSLTLDVAKGILADVTNADLTYYQSELELMDSMFNNKSFLERYYLLILVILFMICIAILWYMARQVHQAALLNQQSVAIMADALVKISQQTAQNSTNGIGQVLQIG